MKCSSRDRLLRFMILEDSILVRSILEGSILEDSILEGSGQVLSKRDRHAVQRRRHVIRSHMQCINAQTSEL